ncbi:MAG: hypothetical protein QOD39_1116, partial [Mycobacterium sp.]|nr:hypothetical protein [Mycobacterium sp.]
MVPSRWPRALWWLLFIPGFVIPWTAFALLGRGRDLGVLSTALIALAVVVPLVISMLCVRWRADARFDAVTALSPSGYVVEGLSCDPTTAALFSVSGARASAQVKRGFAVVVDAGGARFYAGASQVVEFLRLAWPEIESIDLTTVTVSGNRQATALALTVAHDDESTMLPIVIKATKGITGFRYSSRGEVLEHVQAIRS